MDYGITEELLGGRATGEPEIRATNPNLPSVTATRPEPGEGADFWTLVKIGNVDRTETKKKGLAEDRFPHLPADQREKLYGVKDGELYYTDPKTGESRFETAGTWQKVKRVIADLVANSPAEIGSVLGMASPIPGGMAAGAAAGEAVRQSIGHALYGEEQSLPERALKIGLSGAAAQIGAKLGKKALDLGETASSRIVAGPRSQAGVTRGMRAVREAGDFSPINPDEEKKVRALMEVYGIGEPTLVETSGSKRLSDRWSLLGDLPATSEAVQGVKTKRMQEVTGAVDDFLRSLSPVSDPLEAGTMAAKASTEAIAGAKQTRSAAVAPLYEQAFRNAGKVDTAGTIAELDSLLKDLPEKGGSLKPALQDVRQMLFRTEEKAITQPDGSVVKTQVQVPEWDLRRLDNAKKEIDAILNGSHPQSQRITPSVMADKERRLSKIRDALVAAADSASPGYAGARAAYQAATPAVETLQRGAVGSAASLQGDKATAAAQRLLASAFTSPETVKVARAAIAGRDPAAWKAVVRQYVQKMWDEVPEAMAGQTINYGGRLSGKMTAKGRMKILEAAMDPADFAKVRDFQEVMGRTGLLFGRESTTAPRQVAIEEMRAEGRKGVMGATAAVLQTDLAAPGRRIGQWIESRVTTPREQVKILDALQDPRAAAALAKLTRLPRRSRALLEGLSAWLGMAGVTEGRAAFGRATTPDTTPSDRKPQ